MSHVASPVLGAVVLMPRAFDELTAMLSHLAAQTLASRLEVVKPRLHGRWIVPIADAADRFRDEL